MGVLSSLPSQIPVTHCLAAAGAVRDPHADFGHAGIGRGGGEGNRCANIDLGDIDGLCRVCGFITILGEPLGGACGRCKAGEVAVVRLSGLADDVLGDLRGDGTIDRGSKGGEPCGQKAEERDHGNGNNPERNRYFNEAEAALMGRNV